MKPPPMPVQIVPFHPQHAGAAKSLILANQRELGFVYDPQLDRDLDAIASVYRHPGGFWVAVLAAQGIVGTCALREENSRQARLKRLHVARAYRGQRIGLALLNHVVEIARERGFAEIILDTTTRQARAMDLYGTYGFQRTGQRGEQVFFRLDLQQRSV